MADQKSGMEDDAPREGSVGGRGDISIQGVLNERVERQEVNDESVENEVEKEEKEPVLKQTKDTDTGAQKDDHQAQEGTDSEEEEEGNALMETKKICNRGDENEQSPIGSPSPSQKKVAYLDSDEGGGGGKSPVPNFGPFLRQGIMTVVVCLAGLSNGMIYSYPAVALARWEDAGLPLSTAQTTWFASAPLVVAMLVCVGSGLVVEQVGVQRVLMLGTIILTLAWLALGHTHSFWVLLLARVIQGVVASLFMVVITVYPVEVSSIRWRGILVGVSEAMVMLGAFFTYLGGLILLPSTLAYVYAGSLILQLVVFAFVRESPLWLARRDRNEEAAMSLAWLRTGSGEDVDREMKHIKASVFFERKNKPSAWEQLLMLRKMVYLRPTVLCILVLLFKELTGQYAALTYTVTMFKLAGSTLDPYLCAVVMGAARFLPCFLSWALIERLPRRLLLSSCLFISALSFAILGGVLWYWSSVQGDLPEHLGWIPLLCISVFTLAFGCGVGPTSWTLVAELLPSQVRNIGAGILNTCFSLFLFLIGFTFPYSVEAVGAGGVFVTYSVCSLIGVLFVITCLPETRGRSFTEIQMSLDTSHQQQEANFV